MLEIAELLAKGFHHVRVDFYILKDGSLIVGELTFTSASGTCLWKPEEWDLKLGNLIKLPIYCQHRLSEKTFYSKIKLSNKWYYTKCYIT